jgi:hypothetical protein
MESPPLQPLLHVGEAPKLLRRWHGPLRQFDGLRQADEWLNAKQVGQDKRFFRQELTEGLHGVCSRPDALSTAQDCVWRLPWLIVASKVVGEAQGLIE